jgi:primosomal replication protein N
MEQNLDENRAVLTGVALSEPHFSHKTYGESFYMMDLGVTRKSGYTDRVTLMISEKLLWHCCPEEGDLLNISGQIRTYNQPVDGRNHLVIVVFVKSMEQVDSNEPMENYILLEGYICKEPVRRTSPLGRELCDIMLAVNRMFNKSDYIPCIAWGRNAIFGGELPVGTKILIEGRLQSRQYRKYDENGIPEEKTAYEVSVTRMDEVE